jgi:hypothetical protein
MEYRRPVRAAVAGLGVNIPVTVVPGMMRVHTIAKTA